MSKKVGISIADLQQGSKGLQRAPETEKKSNKFESQMREDSIDQLSMYNNLVYMNINIFNNNLCSWYI
jgi:hypothetical protein